MSNYYVDLNLAMWREYLELETVYVTAELLEANLTERRWPRVVRRWEAKHVERLSKWDDTETFHALGTGDGPVRYLRGYADGPMRRMHWP